MVVRSGGRPPAGWWVVAVVVGLILVARGYRLGARCENQMLIVRGLLRSRRIPKTSIREITDFPAVRWSRNPRRMTWTPIIAFAEPGRVIPPVETRNDEAIDALRRWLAVPGKGAARTNGVQP